MLTPEFRLKLIQGLLLELDLESCGEDVIKGCLAIRAELERDPALRDCMDELIGHVLDRLRLIGDFSSQSCSEDAYDEMNSVASRQKVDKLELNKQISSNIKGWEGPALSEC